MHSAFSPIPMLLLALLAWSPADAEAEPMGTHLWLRVSNPHQDDREVLVYDNVCGRVVMAKRLAGRSEMPFQVCGEGMGNGDVTLRNLRTGVEQRYRDVVKDATLRVP